MLRSIVTKGDKYEIGRFRKAIWYLRRIVLLGLDGNDMSFIVWFWDAFLKPLSEEQFTSIKIWHSKTSEFHFIFSRHLHFLCASDFLVVLPQIIFMSISVQVRCSVQSKNGLNARDNLLPQSVLVKSLSLSQHFPYFSWYLSWQRHIPESQNESYGHPPLHLLFLEKHESNLRRMPIYR